jgi:fermentation-respiration switch protein FrsA (DUF1100 family)
VLASAIFVYVSVTLIVWLLGPRFLFPRPPASYRDDGNIIELVTRDGARISATHLRRADARLTILYSHGNAEDLGHVRPTLERLRSAGFSVFGYDYRGYGTSEGTASERTTYDDIEAAFAYLTSAGISPRNILVYGRSIGGGPSVELARRHEVGGLILESTFTSALRVVTGVRLFPVDWFENLSKLPSVHVPVLVMHGTKDGVVPIRHGHALFAAANAPKVSLWVDGANHDDLPWIAGDAYERSLRELAALVH